MTNMISYLYYLNIMKTKNILKIGVFSLALLSLLISPVLKSNVSQVKAASCTDIGGICLPLRITCPSGYKVADETFKLTCPSGVGTQKCCVPSDSEYAKPPQTEREEYHMTQEQIREQSKDQVEGTAKEQNAAQICNLIVYGTTTPDIPMIWGIAPKMDDRWWQHKVCLVQIGILEGIGKMMGGMINALTADILWALNPDSYGGFVKNSGVIEVSGILRTYMNFALILVLIIIALATILGIKKYRWQDILWKLIVVALLINFSLILPGILLDISHFITYVFINLTQEAKNMSIAQAIMDNFRTNEISGLTKYGMSMDDKVGLEIGDVQTIEETDPKTNETVKVEMVKTGWGLAWGNFFLVLAALALMGLFVFITLIAIFFVIMFRSFIIIILLAVSPIAFVAWILPNTEKFWNLWWGQFSKWCLFPISFAISLYIGVIILDSMSDHLAKLGAGDAKLTIISMLVQIVLFAMFLVGGLIVSIQSSGAVGKVVQKQVSRAGWLAGAFAAGKVAKGIRGTGVYRKAGLALTHIPGVSKIGFDMLDQSDKARIAGEIKKREKELEESRAKQELLDIANSKTPSRVNRKAYIDHMAALHIAAKKGWIDPAKHNIAIDEIKNHVNNDNPDLDVKTFAQAFPQFFKVENDKLKIINPKDHKQIIENMAKMNPTDIPKNTERIISAIKSAGGNVEEFLEELVFLKTNQLKAFLDNVDENEFNTGKIFSGTSIGARPWAGTNGAVITALKNRERAAAIQHAKQRAQFGDGSAEEQQALNEWIKAQNALDEMQNKLDTSTSLRETLQTKTV